MTGEKDFRWRGRPRGMWHLLDGAHVAAIALLFAPSAWSGLGGVFDGSAKGLAQQVVALIAAAGALALAGGLRWRWQRRYGLDGGFEFALASLPTLAALAFAPVLRVAALALPGQALAGRLHASWGHSRGPWFPVVVWLGLTFIALWALQARAWRARIALELDSVERVRTKAEMHAYAMVIAVALTALLLLRSEALSAYAPFALCALPPLLGAHRWLTARAVERYRGKVPDAPRRA